MRSGSCGSIELTCRRQSRFANDLEAAFETGVWSKLVLRASDAEHVESIPPFQVGLPNVVSNDRSMLPLRTKTLSYCLPQG